MPRPEDYTHDLNLIAAQSGAALARISLPQRCPRISSNFINPASTLDGAPVFTMRVNVPSLNADPLCGTIRSEVLGRALVEGAEYIWNSAVNAGGRASLLWRTEIDDDSLEGVSGSLLIQGRHDDATAQCLLFRN